MNVEFWQDVADYCNYNWRGKYSDREVKDLAQLYTDEWLYSVKCKQLSSIIVELLKQLNVDREENNNDAVDFIRHIHIECDKQNISIEE